MTRRNLYRELYGYEDLSLLDEWDLDLLSESSSAIDKLSNSFEKKAYQLPMQSEVGGVKSLYVPVSEICGQMMNHASFKHCHLSFICISASELRYCMFDEANLIGSYISLTNLHASSFRGANMEFSEVKTTDLSCANFVDANLQGATFIRSDLRWCNFRGANLADCQISDCKLKGSTFDKHTVLPFDRPTAEKLGLVLVNAKLHDAS